VVGGLTPERLTRALSDATALPLTGRGMHVRPEGTKCIQRISIKLEGDAVVLSTFPAELQGQARAFYGDRSRVARVLDLASLAMWTVRPNGHLSWWLAAPERRWYFTDGSLDASQYMRQWQNDLGHVHSYRRDAVVTELWPWLLRRGYVGERDRTLMQEFVARLPRPDAHLRPGVAVSRRRSLEDANRLQAAGELASALRQAVETLLDTLGEPPLPS
jgi:hypothetical protein